MPERVPSHRPARLTTGGRHREYDRRSRDRDAKAFYDSAAWLKLRRWKLATDPLCERCEAEDRLVPASHVHHTVERRDAPELALEGDNLESLCASHHSAHHATGDKTKQ